MGVVCEHATHVTLSPPRNRTPVLTVALKLSRYQLGASFLAFLHAICQIKLITGENGEIIEDVQHRTGCIVQIADVMIKQIPPTRHVALTGWGQSVYTARDEIRKLILEPHKVGNGTR